MKPLNKDIHVRKDVIHILDNLADRPHYLAGIDLCITVLLLLKSIVNKRDDQGQCRCVYVVDEPSVKKHIQA